MGSDRQIHQKRQSWPPKGHMYAIENAWLPGYYRGGDMPLACSLSLTFGDLTGSQTRSQ